MYHESRPQPLECGPPPASDVALEVPLSMAAHAVIAAEETSRVIARLKELREQGMSVRMLAAQLDVSPTHIRSLLAGKAVFVPLHFIALLQLASFANPANQPTAHRSYRAKPQPNRRLRFAKRLERFANRLPGTTVPGLVLAAAMLLRGKSHP